MQYIQKYFITQFHPSVVTLDQRLLAAHTAPVQDGCVEEVNGQGGFRPMDSQSNMAATRHLYNRYHKGVKIY